jgi:U4/U6.U5 tri-snRNP-associated protein 3
MNIQYDEFGREVRMRSTASNVTSSLQTRRERSPDHGRRRDRSRSPESKHQQQGGNNRNRRRSRTPPELRGYNRQRGDDDAAAAAAERDVEENAFAEELSRYRATHHADQPYVSQQQQQQQQQQRAAKKAQLDTVVLPAGLEEDEMMKMLGLPSQFDTTHERHVDGADASGARVLKKRHARQYMNVVRRQQQLGPTRIRR